MKRAINEFKYACKYDIYTTGDDENRVFNVDIPDDEIYEIVDVVSEGMVVQWLKPYVYKQELLENLISTKDFKTYSPSELLLRVGDTYRAAKNNYTHMVREYSFSHGDVSDLHS